MTKIELKPRQIQDLHSEMINKSMSGNEGLAVVTLRKKTGLDSCETIALNDRLIEIELKARCEMKKVLIDFFNENGL